MNHAPFPNPPEGPTYLKAPPVSHATGILEGLDLLKRFLHGPGGDVALATAGGFHSVPRSLAKTLRYLGVPYKTMSEHFPERSGPRRLSFQASYRAGEQRQRHEPEPEVLLRLLDQAKQGYRAKAKTLHPDIPGGDEEAFKELASVWAWTRDRLTKRTGKQSGFETIPSTRPTRPKAIPGLSPRQTPDPSIIRQLENPNITRDGIYQDRISERFVDEWEVVPGFFGLKSEAWQPKPGPSEKLKLQDTLEKLSKRGLWP